MRPSAAPIEVDAHRGAALFRAVLFRPNVIGVHAEPALLDDVVAVDDAKDAARRDPPCVLVGSVGRISLQVEVAGTDVDRFPIG